MKTMNGMKRMAAMLLVTAMLLCMAVVPAFAEETPTADVSVTVAVKGALVMTCETVTVTDADGDGALTIHDALYAAHAAKYTGGADAGYASANTVYGLSLVRLWGDESGAFGYFLNDAMPLSLTDPIAEGDRVYAYVYTDALMWSDVYAYFNQTEVSVLAGDHVTLTLSQNVWGAVSPLAGATLTVDGQATEYRTDANGIVTLPIETAGEHVISAISDNATITPPVCRVTATGEAELPDPFAPESMPDQAPSGDGEENGDGSSAWVVICIAVAAVLLGAAAVVLLIGRKKKK